MFDVLCSVIFGIFLLRVVLPFISAFSDAVKGEVERVQKEGLIKTDNGAFWSPDQEIKPRDHH